MASNEVLLLSTDLLFGSKIKGELTRLGLTPRPARSLEQVDEALASGTLRAAVVDLNLQAADPFTALEKLMRAEPPTPVIAYCSHVDTERFSRAEALGVKDVFPRSTLIKNLEARLG